MSSVSTSGVCNVYLKNSKAKNHFNFMASFIIFKYLGRTLKKKKTLIKRGIHLRNCFTIIENLVRNCNLSKVLHIGRVRNWTCPEQKDQSGFAKKSLGVSSFDLGSMLFQDQYFSKVCYFHYPTKTTELAKIKISYNCR